MDSHEIHEHHEKAAEHHEHGAKHHREAAKHAEAGDHEKSAHHSKVAHGHSLHANDHHEHASKNTPNITVDFRFASQKRCGLRRGAAGGRVVSRSALLLHDADPGELKSGVSSR